MIANKGTRLSVSMSAKARGINWPLIKSPTKEVFQVTNAAEFARKYNLNRSHLVRVLNGKVSSHKGWRVYKGEELSTLQL